MLTLTLRIPSVSELAPLSLILIVSIAFVPVAYHRTFIDCIIGVFITVPLGGYNIDRLTLASFYLVLLAAGFGHDS